MLLRMRQPPKRYTVEVFEMPKVTEISVAYTYPDYTGLKPVVQTGMGDIQALVGTQAEIKLTTNKAIQTATFTRRVDMADNLLVSITEKLRSTSESVSTEMVISGGNTLTTTIDILENGTYTVELLCIDGFNNEIPIEYAIKAIPDAAPEVVIKEPGRDIKTTKLGEVKVVAETTGRLWDCGIEHSCIASGLTNCRRLTMEPATSTPIVARESGEAIQRRVADGAYTFYLEEFDVEPGDIISYYGTCC